MTTHSRAMVQLVALAVGFVAFTGCPASAPVVPTGRCSSASDCAGGEVCVDSFCAAICQGSCSPGFLCVEGVCQPCTTEPCSAPEIDRVTGTGTADAAHAGQHLLQRLRIEGRQLSGAQVSLRSSAGAGDSIPVVLCAGTASDTAMEVELPATGIVPGQYTLAVANQAGTCSQEIQVVQGEKGDPGSLSVSIPTLIGEMNTATAADSTLRLNGTLSGLSSTITVRADATGVGGRSIKVNGVEESVGVVGGVAAVIFDLTTHTVTDARELANSGTGATALHGLVLLLTPTDVLILATAGDTSQFWTDQVAADLAPLGGRPSLTTVSTSDAVAFIGQLGLGAGNGLVSRGETNAVALSTIVVDDAVVGFGDHGVGAADGGYTSETLVSISGGNGITVSPFDPTTRVQSVLPAYGTVAGTICQGNDARLSDARAPTANSANYIQNQTVQVQTAGFRIDGAATMGAATMSSAHVTGNLTVDGSILGGDLGVASYSCTATSDVSVLCPATPVAARFCALSTVNSNGSPAGTFQACSITKSGSTYQLAARSGGAWTTVCSMFCF
ncbi:MAG: hypothetical protein HY903_04670 [Deltaproteobacteria bacterium]|nr:hypothetical protein [Deltaproteobacteria bacterium]